MGIVGILLAALMGISWDCWEVGLCPRGAHTQIRGGLRGQGGNSLEPRGGGPDKPLRRYRTLEVGQREPA